MHIHHFLGKLGILIMFLLIGCPHVLAKSKHTHVNLRGLGDGLVKAAAGIPHQVVCFHLNQNFAQKLWLETVYDQITVEKDTHAFRNQSWVLLDTHKLVYLEQVFVYRVEKLRGIDQQLILDSERLKLHCHLVCLQKSGHARVLTFDDI